MGTQGQILSHKLLRGFLHPHSNNIPPYDYKLIDEIFIDVKRLFHLIGTIDNIIPKKNTKYNKQNQTIAGKVLVESILRNKRLLLVYHNLRLNILADIVLDNMPLSPNSHLDPTEIKFFKTFDQMVNSTIQDMGLESKYNMIPSTSSLAQVLLIDEPNSVLTESIKAIPQGYRKNTVHLMSEEEANQLHKLGTAKII